MFLQYPDNLFFRKSVPFHSLVLLVGPELTSIWIKIRGQGHARYLAVRVIRIIDALVNSCVDIGNDTGEPGGDGIFHPHAPYPTITFPDDVDWKSIDQKMLYRILSLPNELQNIRQKIKIAAETNDPPDYSDFFEERRKLFSQFGLKAQKISDDLRLSYDLPTLELESAKIVDFLNQTIDEIISARRRSKELAEQRGKGMLQKAREASDNI